MSTSRLEIPEKLLNKQKVDLFLYCCIASGFFVSFIIKNALPFFAIFIVVLTFSTIQSVIIKPNKIIKKMREKENSEEKKTTPAIKKYNSFVKRSRTIGQVLAGLVIMAFLVAQFMVEAVFGVFILIPITFAVAFFLYRTEKKQFGKQMIDLEYKRTKRWDWVDQFRGLVVVFLIIAAITWELSGVKGDPSQPPVGPTFLNHGWKFAEPDGWPDMITIIDIGQQILMFIVGFVGALAYYKHQEREGELGAITHVIRRFLALMIFAIIVESPIFDGDFDLLNWNMTSVFWTSTFPNLAWGSLISLLLVAILKKKPTSRMIVAILLMMIHAVLYAVPEIQDWRLYWDSWRIWEVPFNTINHISIAIMGTCTYDWYMLKTNEDPEKGWRTRILPVATASFVLMWLVEFLQQADHRDATTSLSLMAIATSMFVLWIFYSFDKSNFKIPIMPDLGKNILIMFLLTGMWGTMFDELITYETLVANPLLAMLMVGIVPIVTQSMFAWSLMRFKIYIKF